MLPLMVQESIFHPGHYRVALARTMAQLPKDPMVTTADSGRGLRSQSAEIQNPPMAPVLVDGIFPHTERSTQNFEAEIPSPAVAPRSPPITKAAMTGNRIMMGSKANQPPHKLAGRLAREGKGSV